MIVKVGPNSYSLYHHDVLMIYATYDAVIFLGIYGKMRHRNTIVLTNKNAGFQCDLVQCIYGAHNLADQEEQYSHVPHNNISVNNRPFIRRWSHKIII